MTSVSPTAEGFRAVFRRPTFAAAEIAWRWALGASVAAVFVFYGIEFLDTLPVTNADALLLATRQPLLMGRAISDILRGSLQRAVFGGLVAALALSLLWIVCASFGRLATTRAVLDYFRHESFVGLNEDRGGSAETPDGAQRQPLRALLDLNFMRLAVLLAMVLALAGSAILSSLSSTDKHPRPDLAVILFLLLALVIFVAAWLLNWWLSFAGIFAVRDREDALGAISAAATLARLRPGAILAVSIWTGLAHLVVLSVATSTAGFLFAFISVVPARAVLAVLILVTLAYFAIVDWLYIARLSGYVCIAEMADGLLVRTSPSLGPFLDAGTKPEGTIDRDELILSDISGFALKS